MQGWTRKNGQLVTELAQQEAAVVRGLVSQIRDMLAGRSDEAPQDELAELTGIRTGSSEPPQDRVLGRLLPDFYRTDPDTGETDEEEPGAAGALRSLHEPELLDAKIGAADQVLQTCPQDGGRVKLTADQADNWLTSLNDVRLALGTALDISEEMPESLPEDDPRSEHLGVYHWLTWVQDSLVSALVE
ncbi:DUF2017 domain-containing protein [Saccharopolyspora sp. HNM0983]|uniref:DUF2017 domain-containing protein n=1 Tax=Saccharopolyspora montiporae TaxID=2781240 RepID=A0A929BA40_9PSEU|nr:DUF2017 domain-containing protein [Saccharopolyspora sp. HNM0983]